MKRVGVAGAAAFAAPYVLPSGRLFAQTGARMVDHVVYVMFGGGVRQQESVLMRYLSDSQGLDIPGNIMPNLFTGEAPDDKIVYGQDGELPGERPLDPILSKPLDQQGILFPEVRSQTAGHFNGLVSLLQGNTLITQGLRQRPINPTIFEYLRRHANEPASKVWYIGHSIGNSTPLLNHSLHPDYGIKYGANFFAPPTTFGTPGINAFSESKIWELDHEVYHIDRIKGFLDDYYQNLGRRLDELGNTPEEKKHIKEFMKSLYLDRKGKDVIECAKLVMTEFQPTLLAFSLFGVDVAHGNFTSYLQAMHFADNKIAQIWNHIQSTPGMADNTIMIVCPEHGRNLDPNPIRDQNDWFGYDHSDSNSRRIFSTIVGPPGLLDAGLRIGSESNPVGYSADCAVTIADILGIKPEVTDANLVMPGARSFLDRI